MSSRTRPSRVRRSSLAALGTALLLATLPPLLTGCGGEGAGHPAHAPYAPHAAGLPASAISERSVYLLPSSWTDASGAPVELADLAGRAQVLAMVYTHCSFACPMLLAQVKRIVAVLGEEGLGDRVALSILLGIQYREAGEGHFEHSKVLTILDPRGVPVYRLEGSTADPAPALAALRRVVE